MFVPTLFPLNSKQIVQEIQAGIKNGVAPGVGFDLLSITEEIILDVLFMKNITYLNFEVMIGFRAALTNYIRNNPLMGSLLFVLIIPAVEEILNRGIITPSLKAAMQTVGINPAYAPIAGCLLFGAYHQSGVKLAVAYEGYKLEKLTATYHGSLWASTASHIAINLLAYFQPNSIILNDIKKRLSHTDGVLANAGIGAILGMQYGALFSKHAITFLAPLFQSSYNPTSFFDGSLKGNVKGIAGTIALGAALGAGMTFFKKPETKPAINPVADTNELPTLTVM